MTSNNFQARKCRKCGLRFSCLDPGSGTMPCPHCQSPMLEIGEAFAAQKIRRSPPARRPQEILLDNIRSAWNVGSIFRTAEGAGVRHIYLCGITPTPEVEKVAKTALGAQEWVSWSYHPDGVETVLRLRTEGHMIWVLEGGQGSRPIGEASAGTGVTPLVWVFGNEICGVDPGVLEACHARWHIPLSGKKESLNIAVACGIALYYPIPGVNSGPPKFPPLVETLGKVVRNR